MENILRATNLKKNYYKKCALRGINLEIKKGKIYGLFGPNGSGKTTFMKIAAGLLKESSGEIKIENKRIGPETKATVAYLPDINHFYKWMKIKDAIRYFKDMYSDFDETKAEELAEFMDLDINTKLTSLSKGLLERAKLCLIMGRNAQIYLLDEPLSGIDPVSREKIIDLILRYFDTDKTLIITTHLVQDIERIVEEVIFILDGEIILADSAENLRNERKLSINDLYKEVFR